MNALLLTEEQTEEQKRRTVLTEVKSVVSAEVYAASLSELADSSFTFDYKIALALIG